jgi:23S rRNA (uracil1939-C5)-methyltransferase
MGTASSCSAPGVAEDLTIARLGHRGDGIAETPDGPLYVPYALPGERVRVERLPGSDRAHLIEVLVPSPDRLAPYCRHAGVCGGCAVQHWRPAAALTWKRDLLTAALARAGLDAAVAPTVDAHGAGRRRVTLHARRDGGRLRVGFNVARTHDLIDLAAAPCPLLVPGLRGAVSVVAAAAEVLHTLGKPLDALATATLAGLDLDLRGPGRLAEPHRLALVALAETHDLARLSLHGEVLVERRPPAVRFGAVELVLPPGGFLQATTAGEEALAALVTAGIGAARRVADLFSGCGTFALRLATRAQVTAVESDAAALASLERAARRAPGLKPVTALRRDLFRRPLQRSELEPFDAVVFDPPRAGGEAVARALAASRVPRVVAVSCNPDTLARDLAILVGGGYRLGTVTPIDQFRHAAHVEAVAVLTR